MQPAKQIEQEKILRDLVPLNALSDERFNELVAKIEILEVKAGRYLFRKGERDNQTIYLLNGRINLIDGFRKIVGEISAGDDVCRFPIAAQQPRPHSARVVEKALIARVDSGLLDVFLTWDQSNPSDAVEIAADDNSDWMTRILQSQTFARLPPSKLQGLLMKLQPLTVHSGEVIVAEGDGGDYFYIIDEGRCAVTRRKAGGGDELLAELGSGDSFGEDALVSSNRRNASVTMLTNGQLMRLAKRDFAELLHIELVRSVGIDEARRMVADGAVWLDVRTADEYAQGSFEDSVNIPLAELRGELPELVFNAQYILCCDSGRRSDSAAFLLSNKGFDVYVLEGGMASLSDTVMPDLSPDAATVPGPAMEEGRPAAVADAGAAEAESSAGASDSAREELARSRETEARLREQLEQLRGELGESTGKLGELYGSIRCHDEEKNLLYEQYSALQEEHAGVLAGLEASLAQERDRATELQDRYAQLEQEHRQLGARLTEAGDGADARFAALQQELSTTRARAAELEAALHEAGADRERERQESMHAAQEQARQVELLGGELATARDEIGRLTGLLDETGGAQQARDELEQELAGLRDRLAEAAVASDALEPLQEQNAELEGEVERLRAVLQERDARLEQQVVSDADAGQAREAELAQLRDQLQVQAAAMAELEAAHGQLQTERDEGRAALAAQAEEHQRVVADLQSALGQKAAELDNVAAEYAQLEQQHSEQGDAERERQQTRVTELERESAQRGEELETLRRERDGLLDQQRQHEQDRTALEQEIASLQEQASDLIVSHEEVLAQLQAQLISGETLSEQLREIITGKDARIEQYVVQLGQFEVEKGVLEQELELLRKQHAELREQSEGSEQRARATAEEMRETVRRLHEDLRRKNDNEKELQGQVERLHKKLEQVTTDYRKARSEDRDGLDHLREELHAERAARAEERAQMAARQRELKDQLAAIATEHEDNITNHSDVIEEAVASVRSEERARLQGVLDAQTATEEQLAVLEQELKQAHAELAEFQRQEKDRRQSDIELMQEQNQQAEAAISQLQAQLRELVGERDGAVEEQQVLRERINELRGELESAREEAGRRAQEQAEDPVELRRQLEETRRNVEVAVRLRDEAEAARGRMEEERDRLLVQIEKIRADAIHAPSGAHAVAAGVSVPSGPARSPVAPDPASRRPLRVAPLAFTALAVLAVTAGGWFLLRDGLSPVILPGTGISLGSTPDRDSAAGMTVSPGNEQAGAQGVMPEPVHTEASGAQSAAEASDTAAVAPQTAVESSAPPVLGSFRDRLRGGGSGPLMVTLAAAAYQMGSPGKSDNSEEVPRHEVSLGGFSISSTEVTFNDYDRFARATGRRLPSDERWGRGDQPVINVSWDDAHAYVQWLSKQTGKNYRLPAEAEWEYAARAGSQDSYWWSDDAGDVLPANCFNCGNRWDGARPAPVGQFAANAFGLHDMAGNVQEWTADCYHDNYQGAPADGTAWLDPGCTLRVVRGGAYSSPLDALRSARRTQLAQDTRLDNLGFRVVRDD